MRKQQQNSNVAELIKSGKFKTIEEIIEQYYLRYENGKKTFYDIKTNLNSEESGIEMFYTLEDFYARFIKFYNKRTKQYIEKPKIFIDNDKKLRLKDINDKTILASHLHFYYNCSSCGQEAKISGHCFKDILNRKVFLCKHCMCIIIHVPTDIVKKTKESLFENWGVEVPIQSKKIQEKIKVTMLERHGVEYSAQSLVIRQKQIDTMMERYGKLAVSKGWCGRKNHSILELNFIREVMSRLDKHNLKLTYFYYPKDNEKQKQFFINGTFNNETYNTSVDFYIKELGYVLEVDGDFWHCNLNKFNPEKMHPYLKVTFLDGNLSHLRKIEMLKTHKFVKFMRNIWEDDISNNIEDCLNIVESDVIRLYKELNNEKQDKC